MSTSVDYEQVSTAGLESSPVAQALAGLRADEARYLMSKYRHVFEVTPASESQSTLEYVNRILKEERGSDSEVDRLFGALSEGGTVLMGLDSYPFAKRYAWVNDRFGVSYQLV